VVASQGFEPRYAESESAVLPLNEEATDCVGAAEITVRCTVSLMLASDCFECTGLRVFRSNLRDLQCVYGQRDRRFISFHIEREAGADDGLRNELYEPA
jgi:hypothetical protein